MRDLEVKYSTRLPANQSMHIRQLITMVILMVPIYRLAVGRNFLGRRSVWFEKSEIRCSLVFLHTLTFWRRGRRSRWRPWRRGEHNVWCRRPGKTSGCCTWEKSWCVRAPPGTYLLSCWPAVRKKWKSSVCHKVCLLMSGIICNHFLFRAKFMQSFPKCC